MSMVTRLSRPIHRTSVAIASLMLGLGGFSAGAALAQEAAPPPAVLKTEPAKKPLVLTLDDAINMAMDRQAAIRAARASLASSVSAKRVTDSPMVGLLPYGKIRRNQAENGVSIATAALAQVEMETKNAVNRTYLGVIYAREQLKLAQDAVQTLDATYKIAKNHFDSGESKNVTQDDLDKLSIYKMLAESRVGEAGVGMARAKAALREAIGLEFDESFDLDQGKLTRFYDMAQEFTKGNKVRLSCKKATEMAVMYRPELAQAALLADVTCLEAQAQNRELLHFYVKTFAATSDIHSKVLPSQVINGEYRPGPVGPEMPTFLVGTPNQRTERARILYERALTVSDKARALVALEAEEGCARLNRAAEQIELLRQAGQKSSALYSRAERLIRNDQIKVDALLQAYALDVTNKSSLNEQFYQFGMTLAYLQRATAGRLWECFVGQ